MRIGCRFLLWGCVACVVAAGGQSAYAQRPFTWGERTFGRFVPGIRFNGASNSNGVANRNGPMRFNPSSLRPQNAYPEGGKTTDYARPPSANGSRMQGVIPNGGQARMPVKPAHPGKGPVGKAAPPKGKAAVPAPQQSH